MPGAPAVLRDSHRTEAEGLLRRAVEEEARRSGGRIDPAVLLARARDALDAIAATAAEEYAVFVAALDADTSAYRPLSERLSGRALGTPVLVTGVAAAVAFAADLGLGTSAGVALQAGVTVAVAGASATLLKLTAGHWRAAHHRAGERGQPGGVEQLRLAWLTALEVRGIRPFLDQQRMLTGATRGPAAKKSSPAADGAPRLRGTDRSADARRRNMLRQSFSQLPEADGPFSGRRPQVLQIAQWVHAARASTETKPTVVVLHGSPGSGRSTLAVRAAHHVRDQFAGACVVDLRGDVPRPEGSGLPQEAPLSTRDAMLHLLNRLGAPREQLLFRERSSAEQQLKRLSELYQQHLSGLQVTIVLDDASDAAQIRALLPERSDSLLLVTSRSPLESLAGLPARVHRMAVDPLDTTAGEELLRTVGEESGSPYDAQSTDRIHALCGGLPLALRIAGSSLGERTPSRLAADLALVRTQGSTGAGEAAEAVERALALRYADQPDVTRRLLRRLSLAGRASLGAAAAAALLDDDPASPQSGDAAEPAAAKHLAALARAGLLEHVRGSRYRLHDLVRGFAHARLLREEEPEVRAAAQERLIRSYAELADSVIRMVDGKTSTRADRFGGHGFTSLDAALRWLDEESSFITSALRHAEHVDQAAVLHLLGALCDYCLLRGDLYRLGELSELAGATDRGMLGRSVQWRTGVAARQIGDLDKARTTLSSVVDLYFEAQHPAGAALALRDLGITLHHQGSLAEAAGKLREALTMQSASELSGDRAWTLHALAAVERDRGHVAEAFELLETAIGLHLESESVHGLAWARLQLGQVLLRTDEVTGAEQQLQEALAQYASTQDARGEAWAMTQLARARLNGGEPAEAVGRLREALARHRENEDARGEAWTLYYLGQSLEEQGDHGQALRELERARTMFSRMRDVYGLACARHHSARVTRDQRAKQTGSLRNSGFARQLLQDARQDFHRAGVAHGEAWSCVELAVIDAGNGRAAQGLELADEAARLFGGYGDRRGEDWARFLRCTLLPFASPGGSVVGAAVALEELLQLRREGHPLRDGRLADCLEAYALILERGVEPETGWQAWQLGMVPDRHAREVMGVSRGAGGR